MSNAVFATFPKTVAEWDALRTMRGNRLIDQVESACRDLLSDPVFLRFVQTADDESAVEKSLKIDLVLAAQILREYAKEHNTLFPFVASANLKEIRTALTHALRRHASSPAQRVARVIAEKAA